MPFAKPPAEVVEAIANAALAHLRSPGVSGLCFPPDATFADIERATHAIGQRVAAGLSADALAAAADGQDGFARCPKCQNSTRVTRKKRVVQTPDGPVEYQEPASHCLACRRDFFPSASASEPR